MTDPESGTEPAPVDTTRQTIAISGSTGLVGRVLCDALATDGLRMLRLVRRDQPSDHETVRWDPASGPANPAQLEGIDAVVHLAGENIAEGRWSNAKKRRIRDSRVVGTRSLCESLISLERPPSVLVAASAIGFYGDRGDEILDETSAAGSGFLSDVCREWETATQPALDRGIRVVNLRIGVVLSTAGGALKKMLLPFQFGAGGRVGSGRQYWSWIALDDLVRVIRYCLEGTQLRGPVNAVAPAPVTNSEFTAVLGRVLRRPTLLPLPAFAARLVLGEMANELLLSSARVIPKRLQESGFTFRHDQIEGALRKELGR